MIHRYPQFLSVKEYAHKHKLTVRTTNDRMRRREIGYVKVDTIKLLVDREEADKMIASGAPSIAPTDKLVPVRKFAIAHKFAPPTIYEAIILGKLDAFIAGSHVFIYPEHPTVVEFLKNNSPIRRKSRF